MAAGPDLTSDFLLAVTTLVSAIVQILALGVNPFAPKDSSAAIGLLGQAVQESIQTIWTIMVVVLQQPAQTVESNIRDIIDDVISPWAGDAADYWGSLLQEVFDSYDAALVKAKSVDPAQASEIASAALSEAATLGLGSRVVTAAFEAVLPKSLNVMNWLGPILANFSGFDAIVALWREPQLRAAVGNLSEYSANSTFRTRAPDHADAEALFARRLITVPQVQKLISWSGLQTEFQDAMQQLAYRPVQPFLLARAAEAGAIPASDLTAILQFDGFRDEDITRLMAAFVALALVPYQQQYLVAAVRSTELGTMTPAELGDVMTSINLTQDQQALVQLTVATRKLEQLAELYRKSISEGYGYGTITDQQYVPMLEAIGIGEADAEAHYAVDSVKKIGKAAIVAERAAARLANQQNRAAQKAAVTAFRTGSIDAAGLTAALLAAQMDPEVAGFTVAIEQTKQLGPLTFIYGVELPRRSALVLREKVTALGVQVKAQLVTPADALTTLAGLGIPADNAQALVADWASSHITASDVGVKLPL